jgi:hypothetical protein
MPVLVFHQSDLKLILGFLFVGVARFADADLESGALQIQSLFCYRKKWSFLLFRLQQ